ncbi:MAG: hemerythrin family protein [Acidobacteriota bacterium]
MKMLEWTDLLETGNQNIDAEHRVFVNLVNKLINAIDRGTNNPTMSRLILEIQKYAEFHFVSEENLMLEICYPDFDKHRRLHFELLEKFNINLNYLELGKRTHRDFAYFLVQWFKSHTIKEDKRIVSFLQKGLSNV